MKNGIVDFRNNMLLQMENILAAETPEQIELEVSKAKAIAQLGSVIVESAKVEVDFIKAVGKGEGVVVTGFIPVDKLLK